MKKQLFRLCNSVQQMAFCPAPLRRKLLCTTGADVAPSANLSSRINVVPGRLSISGFAFINQGVLLDASGGIDIGENVHIAYGARLITSTHAPGDAASRAGPAQVKPVSIGKGAWIGAGAIILPGVTVGAGGLIAAGAVVSADTRPNWLYAGVPAKPVRDLDNQTERADGEAGPET